jgi:hypothetical protein
MQASYLEKLQYNIAAYKRGEIIFDEANASGRVCDSRKSWLADFHEYQHNELKYGVGDIRGVRLRRLQSLALKARLCKRLSGQVLAEARCC